MLSNTAYSYGSINPQIINGGGIHRWSPEALGLLINQFNIFLTRGIKVTLVFCEDEETQDYLKSLVK